MTSPARRQYLEIKAHHRDALLAYQVGDFFEFFDEDARVAAQELRIALTARGYGTGERVPLAGVPLHAADTYIPRLVARGYRVAICEQVAPPGRGLVQRAVTRILTPGTIVEPTSLPATRDNYLVAIAFGRRDAATGRPNGAGLAYVDVSTGAFACTQWRGEELPDALRAEVQRLGPAEVLAAERGEPMGDDDAYAWLGAFAFGAALDHYFDHEAGRIRLCRHFGTPNLAAFGCERLVLAATAAGAILAYLERMNPALPLLLTDLRTYDTQGYVGVDGRTWRALEVVEPSAAASAVGRRSTTLLAILDATRTPMGARHLRRTLLQPLRDRLALEERLDAVEAVSTSARARERIAAALDGVSDLERLIARVVHSTATPRELYALDAGLARVPLLVEALRRTTAPAWQRLRAALDPCAEARELITRVVAEPGTSGGGLVRPGCDAELDALVASIADARRWIAALEATERERTGIKSLKVGFNSVFGYYLEVSKANVGRVPLEYQRRQTLITGERYVTAELKEHEAVVLHAEEGIAALERRLYAALLGELAGWQGRLRVTAAALAQADVWLALAEVAQARGYVRPELTDTTELEIEAGRHPILEAALDGSEFIANDTRLDGLEDVEGARVVLLTGPNMAGKSTYLRQVASIVLLAQVGSFVPARRARIGLVDRIFTRVGAEDDLARGLSTFMLEMVETAYILRHATERSLVILDEVGRGTSTRDGLVIARSVIEHLHDETRARTFFATHYHELAALGDALARLRVARMEVAERDGEAVFLHRVTPGVADHSYGVQVARMAGLPVAVTTRAAELLRASPPPVAPSIAERQGGYATPASAPLSGPPLSGPPLSGPPLS
ncbi:MAG: DNA mismatch repair protein MutS, partial [Ktedonobacterales bacterium]|nr:DNA mismatch repair protein MutS [Ktedonobacterales bacterium]